MARLLTIPTTRPTVSMEERRAPENDPDIIPMDDAPVEAPVVDAGTGTGGDAAQAENIDALAASTSPEAPAAAEADPGAEAAADSSVTDAPSAPAAADETTPPAAGDMPAATDADVTDPATGVADAPVVDDVPAASAEGDIAPVPDDVAPVAPAETVNEPAAEASVTDAPAIDPATDVPAAPAGEEQAAAVTDLAAADAAAATDSPVDAGVEPVAPAEAVSDTATDALPVEGGDAAPEVDASLPADVAGDVPPVTGEAPVAPEADLGGAPSGEAVADDLSASTVADDASMAPADDIAAPADAVADAPAEAAPVEPVDPIADVEPEEMTSAWVDGVAVDAEEVKAQIEEAAEDVVDADNVTDELEDAAVALEELAAKVSENLADENPMVTETTVNLTRIVAEKSLERIGEVLDLPPSLESAVTAHDRLRITLESISGKAKEIWEAIKKALAAAWQALVNFFKNLFDSAARVKAAIAKLRTAVKGLKDEAPSGDSVTGSVVAAVNFKGFSSVANYVSALTKIDGTMGPYLEKSKAVIGDCIKKAITAMKDVASSGESKSEQNYQSFTVLLGSVEGFAKLTAGVAGNVSSSASQGKATGAGQVTSGELPGGFVIHVVVPNTAGDVDNVTHGIHATWLVSNGNGVMIEHTPASGDSVKAATPAEMESILDVLEGLVDSVIASKAGVSEFERELADFRRNTEQSVGNIKGDVGHNVINYIRDLSRLAPALVKVNSQFISLCVTLANNGVKYVTASGKLYPSFGTAPADGETVAASDAPALAAPATAAA